MKIVYIANIRLPTERAHGLQIVKTCEALGNTGASVELVVPTRRNAITEGTFSYYGIQKNFDIAQLSVPDFVRFGPLGFVASTIWFSREARRLKSFWIADVIYSRDALVLLQYLLLGRPLVFEAHSKPSFISRIVARRARSLVVISHGLKNAYIAAGVMSTKILVASDAVDEHLFDGIPDRATARTSLALPTGRSIVLYAGHLYPRKGAYTLAQASASLPEMLFVFVGGTKSDIAHFRNRWHGQKNIFIVGHMPHSRVPWYLRAADLLALPNSAKDEDSARFTSPMKLFEYMASGTPILASDVPAVREVLDEDCAHFAEADSPSAFSQGIALALSHPEESLAKAMKAKERTLNFTWDVRAQAILRAILV
jgi:glycosyltransferase involved in cell wall biosynthesis